MSHAGRDALPPGWAWTTLGEICEVSAGGPAPQDEDAFVADGMPFVRVQDMGRLEDKDVYAFSTRDSLAQPAASDLTLFPKGTVLFTKSGMSTLLNQRAILGRDMCVVSHIGTCIPYGDLPSEWIYYWLKTVDFKDLTHATTLPSLQLPKVRAIGLPLPPVPEQRRIVAKIEELFSQLDAGVEELKKAKAQLKRYRQSVLKAAFEGKLTEEWRKQNLTTKTPRHKEGKKPETAQELLDRIREERKKALGSKYKEPPPLDASELPELPEGWAWARLDEISAKITDGTHFTPTYVSEGVPFISVKDIHNGEISFDQCRQIPQHEHDELVKRCNPERGDVLITKSGTIGRTAVVKTDRSFSLFVSVALIKLPRDHVDAGFMSYALQDHIRGIDVSQAIKGGVIKNYHIEDLKATKIPFPPQAEQRQIVAETEQRLSVVDAEEKAIEAALKQAARLRQSILKRAFEGRLVPQDPTDLPAPRPGHCFIYALECSDGSHYIGQTEDVERRWCEHVGGRGADWTKTHPPVALVHWEEFESREKAVEREQWLKTGFGRKWLKRELAAGRTRRAGEPASILLERIRAEKAKREAGQSRGRGRR